MTLIEFTCLWLLAQQRGRKQLDWLHVQNYNLLHNYNLHKAITQYSLHDNDWWGHQQNIIYQKWLW